MSIVQLLFWILSGTTRVSWYQEGKTNVDLLEQEIVSGSGICWAICKSAPQTITQHPPLSFLQARCPSCRPTNSVKALKAQSTDTQDYHYSAITTTTVMAIFTMNLD